MMEATWRHGVRIVRGTALGAAMGVPAPAARGTAFDFTGSGGQRTWFGLATLKPGYATGPHHHGRHEVAIYVAQGNGEIRWGDRLQFAARIGPGDFVYFTPFVPHEERNTDPSETLAFVVVRSDNERIAVPLDFEPAAEPELV